MINTETALVFNGRKVRLTLAYDLVLEAFELFKDKDVEEPDKLDTGLYLLTADYKRLKRLSCADKSKLLTRIYDEFLAVKSKPSGDDKKIVDFKQDAGYIFASFYMDYGIDLSVEKIDWRKFIALFQGLSERTKIREVMAIRARKLPERTKYNGEEIDALQEAKRYYALEYTAEEKALNFRKNVDRFGARLEAMAKGR